MGQRQDPSAGRLFAYGTLRLGHSQTSAARALHSRARWLGFGQFRGRLYAVSDYPGAVDSENSLDVVVGDLFDLGSNHDLLETLDAYEGVGRSAHEASEFVRALREIDLDGRLSLAWIYLYNRPTAGLAQIVSGNFIA